MARTFEIKYRGHRVEITQYAVFVDNIPIIRGPEAVFFYRYYRSKATREDIWQLLLPYLDEFIEKNPTL